MKYVLQKKQVILLKTAQRNKCEKLKKVDLDTSSIQASIETS